MNVFYTPIPFLSSMPGAGLASRLCASVLLAQTSEGVAPAEQYLTLIGDILTRVGLRLLAAIVIVVVGRWLAQAVARTTKTLLLKREVEPTVVSFISTLVHYVLLAGIIVVALGQLGVQTASMVAILGAAGLAIGLALQGSLSNFAAGVLLIMLRPFKAGDLIEADGVLGFVDSIELFTTTLKSLDNLKIIMPNANILNSNITNISGYPIRRIDLVFGVSYADNLDRARQIIQQVLDQDDRILAEPAPTIQVFELADSSVNFAVRPWVNGADYWTVLCDTTETVKKQFDAAGITIPFPQRDLHVYQQVLNNSAKV